MIRYILVVLGLFLFSAPTVANDYENLAVSIAKKVGVRPQLLLAVCKHESLWTNVPGDDGRSIGLCQIQITTALIYKGKNWNKGKPDRHELMRKALYNPTFNLTLAANLLKKYVEQYDGDESLAMVAYNGGDGLMVLKYAMKVKKQLAYYEGRQDI